MNIILLDLLWFRMLYSSARIEICPQELYWSKVLAFMDKHPCHPARPLVSDVAVKGFGGKKTFHRVAAILIHLASDKCSPPNVEGAGQLHVYKRYTRLLSKNIHFNCFEYQLFCLLTSPKVLLHQGTAELTNLIWNQDSSGCSLSDVETYSSSPHIPNKSFAFY